MNPVDDDTVNAYEQSGCLSLKIAIAPHDADDEASVQAVYDFMEWVYEVYPSTYGMPCVL